MRRDTMIAVAATLAASLTATSSAIAQEASVIELEPVTVEGITDEDAAGDGYRATTTSAGTRIEAPIEEQPLSIQVLPSAVIEDTNATRLEDALGVAAGFATGNTRGGTIDNFLFRGFEAAVATDGAVENPVFGASRRRDTANIERIEILRGPSSALYGQGQPGGVINLVTKKPFDTFAVEAESTGSTFALARQELDVNIPFGERWNSAVRAIGVVEGSKSFRFFDSTGKTFTENRELFAPSLAFSPTDQTSVVIGGEYLRSSDIFDRGVPLTGGGSFAASIYNFYGDVDDTILSDNYIGNVEITHEFSEDLSLRLFGGFDRNLFEGFSLEPELLSPITFAPLNIFAGETIFRQLEFRDSSLDVGKVQADLNYEFETGPASHQILLSIEYSQLDDFSFISQSGTFVNLDLVDISEPNTPTTLTPADLVPLVDQDTTIENFGFVFYDQISLFDRVHILGGGRLDVVEQKLVDNIRGGAVTEVNETRFSPRTGIVIEPITGVPAYLFFSYGESFLVNTVAAVDGGILPPQTGRVYEGGIRYGFNDDRLLLTATVFDIRQENVPFSIFGDVFTTSTNRSSGFEITAEGEVTPQLSLFASYAYTDSEFAEVGPGAPDVVVGQSLQGVPLHSAGLLARYNFAAEPLDRFSVTGAIRYVGERVNFPTLVTPNPLNPFGPPVVLEAIELDPYVRIDLGASYEISEYAEISAGVQNLLNHEIASPGTINLAIPEAPFTAFLTLNLTY